MHPLNKGPINLYNDLLLVINQFNLNGMYFRTEYE